MDEYDMKMILRTIILVTIITYIRAEEPEFEPCEPETKFFYYCNQCFCDINGTGAACTRKYCSPEIYNKDGTLRNPDDMTINQIQIDELDIEKHPGSYFCEPGRKFKYFCNMCVCSSNGFEKACTKQYCKPGQFNEDGSLNNPSMPSSLLEKNALAEQDLPELPRSGYCEEGRSYKQNCNRCACLGGGQIICTQMRCPAEKNYSGKKGLAYIDLPEFPKDGKCVPGSLHRMSCNICSCREDGLSFACQYGSCIGQGRKDERKLDTRSCASGSVFLPDQCFKCTCLGNGRSICNSHGCSNKSSSESGTAKNVE